ncbi:MAG: hypothetical protein AB1806_20955 [Acidobacteriota bacterium]
MWNRRVLIAIVNVGVALALLELSVLAMLHVPALTVRLPTSARDFTQKVYRHFRRNIIQFDPACARWDAVLGYTLRPGTCTFGNVEFSNEYLINSAGLRDAEGALDAPEVIVLGDSQVMGWAVSQDDAFPQVLGRKAGLRVLNAGISSYGTVRERLLLDRLDGSRLKALVIQYTDNDIPENLAYWRRGNRYERLPEPLYREAQAYNARQQGYYPGKYVFRLAWKFLRLEAPEPAREEMDPAVTPADEARLFLNALVHAGRMPLDGVQVIVFEVHPDRRVRRSFVTGLNAAKGARSLPGYVRDMVVLDTQPLLKADDFFVIDDHLRARGHETLADAVREVLISKGLASAQAERTAPAAAVR